VERQALIEAIVEDPKLLDAGRLRRLVVRAP